MGGRTGGTGSRTNVPSAEAARVAHHCNFRSGPAVVAAGHGSGASRRCKGCGPEPAAKPEAAEIIPATEIPARADADERFVQDVMSRARQQDATAGLAPKLDLLTTGVLKLATVMRDEGSGALAGRAARKPGEPLEFLRPAVEFVATRPATRYLRLLGRCCICLGTACCLGSDSSQNRTGARPRVPCQRDCSATRGSRASHLEAARSAIAARAQGKHAAGEYRRRQESRERVDQRLRQAPDDG